MLLRLLKNDLLHGKLTNFMVMIFLAVSTMLSLQYIPDLLITKPDILLHGRYGKGGRL